ncbi:MAG: NADH:flavin oxidoreductase, partial [Clostridiales bacterium]
DPGVITSLINLSDIIKRYGALASIQLLHAGRRSDPRFNQDGKVYGPSAGICHYGNTDHLVTELDEAMIDHIVNAFGDGAEMAKLGGFQMCQVHGGHGWLINQFLSPANNQRTDCFGGSIENRCRFALMVVENIRAKCGPNFPIEFRLSGDDFMENGATLADTVELAKMLEGKVDSIQVSATSFHNPKAVLRMFPTMYLPRGCNAYLAAEIKKHVSVPVITVGGYNDPAQMEGILARGEADMIAMGRALTLDPDLPEKIRTGQEEDIIYCLRCGLCNSSDFVPYVKYALGVARCAVNPWQNWPAERKLRGLYHSDKTVLVVGGGPGGMMAALGAAENGNRVI